ncbi:MAG: hypothetical protein EBU66_07665 [Bacteroidetes bacterium]|nr:hypothetical protein [Bacteroidota bacterium]
MNSHETIDKFLSGQLTPEETSHFLEKVEHDPELQSLLESDRIINMSFNKERLQLMQHDLSGVAGAFVAGLASTGTIASSGLLTAAYAKKAGMSWITLATSSALSISVCAGAYWFINSNKEVQSNQNVVKKAMSQQISTPISLKVPSETHDIEKLPIKTKNRNHKHIMTSSSTIPESAPTPHKKLQLEHSLSKYRPKTQE